MGRRKVMAVLLAFIIGLGALRGWDIQARAEGVSTSLENETVKLELLNECSELRVTDKRTGDVWSSSMCDPAFDLEAVSGLWRSRMTSLFSVSVTNLATGFGTTATFDLHGADYTAEPYRTEEGIGVVYDLRNPAVRIALEFSLTEEGFRIRIPNERIEEYGDAFSLISLDLMTFFGAGIEGGEGYFLYPDGSGAIMRFDDPAHLQEPTASYYVYGNVTRNQELLGLFEDKDPEALLPVFGGNYGDKGFVAYVTEGDESCAIKVSPATTVIKVNYIYPMFQYRRGFEDPRVSNKTVLTYDPDRISADYEIHYSILPSKASDYSGMASAYRRYLAENGKINRLSEGEAFPLSVDLFMGIKEEGVVFDTFQSVTTFGEAREILEDLKENISGIIKVSLKGWTSGGYGSEPKYFPPNRKLGGKKGLRDLAEYALQNGIELSLDANFMTVDSGAGGYSKNKDIVYLSNYQVLTNRRESVYLMSPDMAWEEFVSFIKKAQEYKLSGLRLENIGEMVYYNYAKKNTVSSGQCREYWREMLQGAKESLGSVTAGGGNGYVLEFADMVTDIPTEDCGYQMTTESVPFYQMVVHGYADYTGKAMNLSSDSERQLLKWIEYGYIPYFEITYESADKLIRSDYSELFTSEYAIWRDRIIEDHAMMREALEGVRTEEIVSHTRLKDGVYRTVYGNGTRIYVNYGSLPVTVEGVEIGAGDYAAVGGGSR